MEVADVWKEGEARMCQVRPLVGRRETELRGVECGFDVLVMMGVTVDRGGAWRDRKGGYWILSVGIDIALVSIGHGRLDNREVGLSTRMISAGDEVTSLGTYPVSLVLWCRQATSWEF
jgi:hypothetical protein